MEPANLDSVYAIKSIFKAHEADVRAIAATSIPEGGVLTGSRDCIVKLWPPEMAADGHIYKENFVFAGPSNFIASLCVLPASSQFPEGLFLAGSNDCSIYGFTPSSTEPVLRLLGHSGPVCSLSYGKVGVISGSWDKTARIWSGQICMSTLPHPETVWATGVFPTHNGILTGSADHLIRLWRRGVVEKIFTGHEDCVRGLVVISDTQFLSCSNDSTVRLWMTTGECLQIFREHTDYIYGITLLDNGADFATCGEDQTIRIWRKGVCIQKIIVSPKSLWSIACLSNGDLAVGSSNGKVYVLQKVPVNFYEEASRTKECVEGFETENEPSCSSDNRSNMNEGETSVCVKLESTDMYVCKYSPERGLFVKAEPINLEFIDKTFYKTAAEDKKNAAPFTPSEKDYVFNVEVENSIYKLAFNKGENPWDVANNFVTDHNLQPEHTKIIVDFIIQNSGAAPGNEFYPTVEYITYSNVNLSGLRKTLIEFTDKVDREHHVTPYAIDDLILLARSPDTVSVDQLSSLDKIICWNDEYLYPALDLMRLAVKCEGLSSMVSTKEFLNRLLYIFMNTSKSVNSVLVVKILCNMFGKNETEEILAQFQDKIYEFLKVKIGMNNSIKKAGCALLLNFAVAAYRGLNFHTESYCENVIEILRHITVTEPVSVYRILVAIGTVCFRNELAVTYFKAANVKDYILTFLGIEGDNRVPRLVDFLRLEL